MLKDEDGFDAVGGPGLPAHLYVHVPFCASKCDYCDFASVAGAHPDTVELVFAGIRSELAAWGRASLPGVIETVYFGGGTPSLHTDHVIRVLDLITETFVVHPGAEITVEANPDSIPRLAARSLRDAGVTRVSVGVQSFSERELRVLGRRHDARAATMACEAVVAEGLDLSVDLICGIPGQSADSWVRSLGMVGETKAVHASIYPLSIEDGTPLQVAVDNGLLPAVDDDAAAEHMVIAEDVLGSQGFERYEIANYAKSSGNRARHNTAYWTGRSYIGVGPGAHGMVELPVARAAGYQLDGGEPDSRVRYHASKDIELWLTGEGGGIEILAVADALREDAMLGMRMSDGITDALAAAAGVSGVLAKLERRGLVTHEGGRWGCTRRGWLLGNEVFSAIWNEG